MRVRPRPATLAACAICLVLGAGVAWTAEARDPWLRGALSAAVRLTHRARAVAGRLVRRETRHVGGAGDVRALLDLSAATCLARLERARPGPEAASRAGERAD